MSEKQKLGGQRGATYGYSIEHELARRVNGEKVKQNTSKTDVIESPERMHSVKNTRKSQHCRFLARSYNVVKQGTWHNFIAYITARETNNLPAEQQACIDIAAEMNNPITGEQILKEVIKGTEGKANLMSIYDNRRETTKEDRSAPFRCFCIDDILALYSEKLTWTAKKGRKHWSVIAYLNDFPSLAIKIELGSATRKLLLFTFCNVQKQADHWESHITPTIIHTCQS